MQSIHNNRSVDSAISPNNISPNLNTSGSNSTSSGCVDLSKTALLIREVS